MIFKKNRILKEKEKIISFEAYQSGFENGYKVASKELTDFVKRHCEAIAKGEPLEEEMPDGIITYGKMMEGWKKFLAKMEGENEYRD